jgi:hypothetical protein
MENFMLTELNERLKPRGVTVRGFFPGTNPNATIDQVEAAINKAIDNIEAGDFELVDECD